jgi:hypothetical protein
MTYLEQEHIKQANEGSRLMIYLEQEHLKQANEGSSYI